MRIKANKWQLFDGLELTLLSETRNPHTELAMSFFKKLINIDSNSCPFPASECDFTCLA